MYRFQRSPLLLFIALLVLTTLACRAEIFGQSATPSDTTEPPLDQQAIVDQAVATVMAQVNAQAAAATPTAASETPINTDLEASMVDLYQRVNPAVVHIYVLDEQSFALGTGSGFVYDAQGHIVTNNHVVTGASGLEVVFANGER
ncbi:MAG: serine protease, partial [Candidatus Promineofilum sp.]|nr:serine protease [Promineifilum sp.]